MRLVIGAGFAAMTLATAVCGQPDRYAAKASAAVAESKDAFLARVDTALTARDARALLGLADINRWRDAGRDAPAPDALQLPPPPLKRLRQLSETEVLYGDGPGGQWRLSLRADERGGWSIVLHDRLCPATGGMGRGIEYQRPAPQQAPGAWAPLECWPLPK